MKGRLNSLTFSRTGEALLTIETREDVRGLYDRLAGGDIEVSVKKYREKRSLDANAYCWALLTRLSAVMEVPKEDLYREYIRDVGDNCDVICAQDKAVKSIVRGWQHNGIGWLADTFPARIDGYTNVILYYGSSVYDTAQMSRLINMIVEDCRVQGIETRDPEEIRSLLEEWDGR